MCVNCILHLCVRTINLNLFVQHGACSASPFLLLSDLLITNYGLETYFYSSISRKKHFSISFHSKLNFFTMGNDKVGFRTIKGRFQQEIKGAICKIFFLFIYFTLKHPQKRPDRINRM